MSSAAVETVARIMAERDEAIRLLHEGFEALNLFRVTGADSTRIQGDVETTWVGRTSVFLREHKHKAGL